MRKFFCKFVLTLVFCSSFALANNSFFITLNPSLPNSENSVIEAFSYKCIHCYNHHKFGTLEKLREAF
ncbi:thiol:disulfide interchange protein DsbA/DsbL, partial [Campylobacter jejuni]|nr:thiol:disulfide interchange protein DsbA/DsbL [Campylobacter jejuni]